MYRAQAYTIQVTGDFKVNFIQKNINKFSI